MVTAIDKMKDIYRREYERNPVFTLFLTILIVFFVIFVIVAIITGGDSIYYILVWDHNDVFMDYFNSVMYSSDRPYTYWLVVYPPLITSFYAFIGHFTIPYISVASDETLSFVLRDSQMGLMSFVAITLITFYLLYVIYSRIMKDMDFRKELMFLFLVVLSYPFIYALERGNSIILALVFCLLFILGYKSENKVIRYLSYIALGVAAGIKLYPAILWLLIVRERKYKEAWICLAFVLALALVPFLFTDGNPIIMLDTIFSYTAGSLGFTNITQILTGFIQEILGLPSLLAVTVGYVVLGIFTILSFFIILYDKEMKFWKILALLGCNLVLGLGVGAQYQIIYMLPAMLFFLVAEKNMTRENLFFVYCFAMMMVLIPGLGAGHYMTTANGVFEFYPSAVVGAMESALVILVSIAILGEGLKRLWRNRSAKRRDPDTVD